ncbi:MAG: hypothetical protein E6Q27_09315 [Aeromicrobium sp.]|nr:MAG: hypothetical protein E6Q27_09315 [Aeromicrobium sp.]
MSHRIRTSAIALVLVLALASCSGNGETENPGPEVPPGTELGSWDSTMKLGESTLLVLGDQAGGTSGTIVRLDALEVRRGPATDLDTFSGVPSGVEPWYVSVEMHNRGPADLDMALEKGWVLRVSDNLVLPPANVHGVISECPTTPAGEPISQGAEHLDCLVFLVSTGQRPSAIEYLRHDGVSSVAWRIPSSVTSETSSAN